jgi:hypothetical protein
VPAFRLRAMASGAMLLEQGGAALRIAAHRFAVVSGNFAAVPTAQVFDDGRDLGVLELAEGGHDAPRAAEAYGARQIVIVDRGLERRQRQGHADAASAAFAVAGGAVLRVQFGAVGRGPSGRGQAKRRAIQE